MPKNEKLEIVDKFVKFTDNHIFLTGKAGTGKTTFLRNLAIQCDKRMVIVAPTGVAAINAGGVTIHSFFQLPFGPQIPDDVADTGLASANAKSVAVQMHKINGTKLKIIRSLDLLVIDEISMVRADLLDAVDSVLRRVRRSDRAFGGVQLLMIGDVHQLAPVAREEEWELLQPYYDSVYFFSSHVLKKTPYITIELEHVYRQSDTDFINVLNKVRDNCIDKEGLNILNSRYIYDFQPDDKDGYVTLTTHNYQADNINENKLKSLQSKEMTFEAEIKGTFFESSYPTKQTLILKKGAQVMFVKNDPTFEKRYYNGKIGKIVDFKNDVKPIVSVECDDGVIDVEAVTWQNFEYSINNETKEIEEKEIGSFTQIPLKTAWAITIHKSQGLTFNKVVIDAEQAFAHGQVYVALSRCTSLDGLVLRSKISSSILYNDLNVNEFVKDIALNEPDEQRLEHDKSFYELKNILELFDFNYVEKQIFRLRKAVYANAGSFAGKILDDLDTRYHNFNKEIFSVANKFAKQIESLFSSNPNIKSNEILQERIRKGSAYFLEKLKDIETIPDMGLATDNKTVNTLVKSITDLIAEQTFVKAGCLNLCKNGFDLVSYLQVKNKKTVEFEDVNKQKTKLKVKGVNIEDKALYDALMWWRENKADELGMEEASVLPTNVLLKIVDRKPVNNRELKAIPKLGLTRIKRFGEDIINMVLGSQGL